MTARDVGIGLTLAGADILDVAVDRARITWGRGDLFDQPDVASTVVVIDVDRAGWNADALPVDVGAELVVTAPAPSLPAVTVYCGRVADMFLEADDATGHTHLRLVCDDALAQLAHVFVGDQPWPQEAAYWRARRVVALLPPPLNGYEVEFGALPEIAWELRARDVDHQPAMTVLHDVANSTDTGLYLVTGEAGETPLKWLFHGLSLDHPGRVFDLDVGSGLYEVALAGAGEVNLSAGYLERDVVWTRGLAQLVTVAEVGYFDTVAAEDATVIYRDAAVEAAHGTRRERLSTALVDQADAEVLAARTLLRGIPSWRTETLTWDADLGGPATAAAATLQTFLDMSDRVGLAVLLTDLPAWVPDSASYVFVEGGQLEYLADQRDRGDANVGRWVVTMAVVPAGGIGAGITYAQALSTLPGMTYENVDPAVRYLDALAIGV